MPFARRSELARRSGSRYVVAFFFSVLMRWCVTISLFRSWSRGRGVCVQMQQAIPAEEAAAAVIAFITKTKEEFGSPQNEWSASPDTVCC